MFWLILIVYIYESCGGFECDVFWECGRKCFDERFGVGLVDPGSFCLGNKPVVVVWSYHYNGGDGIGDVVVDGEKCFELFTGVFGNESRGLYCCACSWFRVDNEYFEVGR